MDIKQERLNYTMEENGKYVGYLVNLPQVCASADSLEELERKCKKFALKYLEFYVSIIDQDEPFESKYLDSCDWLGNKKDNKS